MSMSKCEHVSDSGHAVCPAYGNFIVGTGTRKTDRQRSCGRHLSATVIAFFRLGDDRPVTVTWAPIWKGDA